jgi:hypothetical protein
MISSLEQTAFALADGKQLSPELRARLAANDTRLVNDWRRWLSAPIQFYKPSEFLEGSNGNAGIVLNIKAAKNQRWSFEGREYLREQIDQIENPECRMLTSCGGTGSGKTLRDYGIILYELIHNPFSGLYVMPADRGPGGAAAICSELQDTLDASADPRYYPRLETSHLKLGPPFAGRLPLGAARKVNLTRSHLEFGGNDLDFVGANSANQLGNKRCRIVFLGEQDKVKETLGREAGTDYLAGERIKNMSNTKIIRGSTPSLEGFGIWKALMGTGDNSGSDCRRRFLPCPFCSARAKGQSCAQSLEPRVGEVPTQDPRPKTQDLSGYFVLIKDDQYNTALPTKFPDGTEIKFAKMRWDKEAKRKDGTWDMDRVIRSTRFECPHCGGHVRDEHRLWMDKNGVWIPTRVGEPGHFGYQLASYYAPLVRDDYGQVSFESTWGGMAQKFLKAIEDGTIGGYINSDLAEVNSGQNNSNKIEVGSTPISQTDWIPLLTADFQKNHPYLWFVVRKWCAFKLLPPGGITAGIPDFVKVLDKPGNEVEKKVCTKLAGGASVPASHWQAIGELLRFEDPRKSALIEFLLGQKIVGAALNKIFREDAFGMAMDFRRVLYRELSLHLSGGKDPLRVRAPRGGDSELVAAGYVDHSGEYAWDELRERIQQFEIGKGMPIPGRCVGVDCGYAEKFHREVLMKCHESGSQYKFFDPSIKTRPPMFFKHPRGLCVEVQSDGWFAMRGKPSNKPLGDGKFNHELNTNLEDPYFGTAKAGEVLVEVLEFPSGLFWNHKNNLRAARTKNT